MSNTPFSTRTSEFAGDLTVWMREYAGDNSERLERLYRNLRKARKWELTPRQQQMLCMYFDDGRNMTQIALELGVNRSTVSRTLARAKQRLYRCLRYGL
jgi:RNA polymerase sigma factor (sigma-70 family)